MVGIASIRSTNAAFTSTPGAKGLVAVFVGATAGIGEAAMKAFVSATVEPTVYFVGRSEESGAKITTELKALNPGSRIQFMQADTTLLSTVDTLTAQIAAQESKLNLLFMSPGYFTMAGRDESPEGLDRKMVVSYYCRLRFATNLLPLLTSAATSPTAPSSSSSSSARVISVLGPGHEGALITDDLSLTNPANFGMRSVMTHTVTMTSLAFEELSIRNPDIAWMHVDPGVVLTGLRGLPLGVRMLGGLMTPVLKCFSVPPADSGQGFTWLATSEGFRKGLFLVNWRGESVDSRGKGVNWWAEEVRGRVWAHTQEVFARVGKGAVGA